MNFTQVCEIKIERLNFSVRTHNCLKGSEINTIHELVETSEEKLLSIRNLGSKSLEEIKCIVSKLKSGDFAFEEIFTTSEKTVVKNEIYLIDILSESDRKISKVLFYDEINGYFDDIEIKNMNLTIRSFNALQSEGYRFASHLLNLKLKSFYDIKNLGEKSRNEIIDKLKLVTQFIYNEDITQQMKYIKNISDSLIIDYKQSLVVCDYQMLYNNICKIVEDNIDNIDGSSELKNLISDELLLSKIYKDNFLSDLLKGHIIRLVNQNDGYIDYSMIVQTLPNHLKNSALFNNVIDNLIKTKKLEQNEGYYRIWCPKINEYIISLNNRDNTILLNRFQGKTLEETGNQLKITREGIRQLEKKAINRVPRVREDDYKEVFEKYNWTCELFKYSYNELDIVFGYLNSRYSKGDKDQEYILEDNNIPIQVRLKAEKLIYKDYIIYGGLKIKKDRYEILDYILRTYCRDEVTSKELSDLYLMFINDIGLQEESELIYPDRYFETTLAISKKVLWKQGKKLRYYNFSDLNAQKIIEALNLTEFENVEYSTLKFFNEFPEIMDEWDLRDEYELHNLMKKMFQDNTELNISMARMPNIEFGKPDRDMQVLDILLQTAPIENYELAKVYESEYGVKAETALANYFKCIDIYYHNGLYSIDSDTLVGDEYDIMKDKLVEDMYFFKDVKEMYIRLFPTGNPKLINPYNLKRLGFKINTSIIYSDKYSNSEQYFRKLMMKDDIFDATLLDSRLKCCPTYYRILQILAEQFEVIEFLPNKFINIRRLEKKGIIKRKLKEFIDYVFDFVGEELFTIRSLRRRGFEHELFELGFDDLFYSALLKYDNRFKFRRVNENLLLRKGREVVTLNDLIEHVVYNNRSIDIYDLIELIISEYGITMDRYSITHIVMESGLYYNAVMEKVYIDYDEYFEEV